MRSRSRLPRSNRTFTSALDIAQLFSGLLGSAHLSLKSLWKHPATQGSGKALSQQIEPFYVQLVFLPLRYSAVLQVFCFNYHFVKPCITSTSYSAIIWRRIQETLIKKLQFRILVLLQDREETHVIVELRKLQEQSSIYAHGNQPAC